MNIIAQTSSFFHNKYFHLAVTIILLFLIVCVFLVSALHHSPAVIDDAYISFRYSANFAEGRGLVYNTGARVEGFSNFLWTIIIGIAMKLGNVDAMYFSKILGMLATLGLIFATYYCSRLVMGRWHIVNFVPPLLVAANTYLAHWSVMGLASSGYAFLIFVTIFVLFLEHKHHWRVQVSPFLAALTIMMRIDGAFFLGIMIPVFWVVLLSRGEFNLKRFAWWVLSFAALMVPYFAFRLLYFRSLFPNPYYAKVDPRIGHSRGMAHLFYFFFQQGWGFMNLWLVPAVAALFWRNRYGILCLVMVLLIAFFVWYVNGDWMPNYRFLLPIIPFVALNIAVLARLAGRIRFKPAKLVLLLLLAGAVYNYLGFHFHEKSIYIFDWNPHMSQKNDKQWFYPGKLWDNLWQGFIPPLQNVANWIFNNVPDGAQVMTSDIGYPGFLNMNVRIIDIDGLTDRFIGRAGITQGANKKKQRYIMDKEPEFIFIFINHQSSNPSSPGYAYPDVSRLIYNSDEFRRDYEEVAQMNKYLKSWVHLFKRKDTRMGLTQEEKIERLKSGIERNPRVYYLYPDMIRLCRAQDLTKETWEPYIRKAFRLFRGNPQHMRDLGNKMMDLKMPDLAQQAYSQSLDANPRQQVLYTVLASLYRDQKEYDKGIDLLKKGHELFPRNRGISHMLKILQEMKQKSEGNKQS